MPQRSSRLRRGLVGVLFVLAIVGVIFSSIAVWMHQTLLVTDRFVAVTERIATEPEVQALVADRLSKQIVTAVDVQGRVAGVLPPNQAFLAVPLATAVQGLLDQKLTALFAEPRAQAAFVKALAFTHQHLITVLRNQSDVVTAEGSTVTIDLLPVAVEGLKVLQENGILPADIVLPDVTDPAGRDAAIAAIESKLGRDLPPDFAQIEVADATRFAAAQGAVRAFDLLVVGLLIVTLILMVATVWLARRHLRMVAWLGIGSVVALILARIATRGIVNGLVSDLAAGGSVATIRLTIVDLLQDLRGLTTTLIVIGIIIAIIAWIAGRPRWAREGVAAAKEPSSEESGVEAWGRQHADGIGWTLGILAGVLVLWITISPELAVLGGIVLTAVGRWWMGRADRSGDAVVAATTVAPVTPVAPDPPVAAT